jgi:hypothetical protein
MKYLFQRALAPLRKKLQILYLLLALVTICLALFLVIDTSRKAGQSSNNRLLPKFLAKNINGDLIDSSTFHEKYTYIQFARSDNRTDAELILRVASDYSAKMNIVLILDPSLSNDNLPRGAGYSIILDEDHRLRELFNVPTFGFYLIFDPKGRIVESGMNQVGYTRGPKYILSRNVDGLRFSNEMLIPPKGRTLRDYGWLVQLDQKIQNQPRNLVLVCLFSSVCEGCPSGEFINHLKEFRSAAADKMDILYLLPLDYTNNDLLGLTSQLSTNFPVEIADPLLGQKWMELISAYGEEAASGIVFVANRNGLLMRVLDLTQSLDHFFDECLRLALKEPNEQSPN